ncbi:hypothetical protein SAMN05421546_1579 [Solilutibacter tolerans]|uniref:Uncharacterized protein n=2 Tax=Solilutibacter tolerans TaxID=1604334 RepID=A0A1N6U7X3_9GAMM|nr:hypothetical protein SAMN05421546_1579 [Lysobacter tolerans]
MRYVWLALGAVLLALGGYGCMRMKPRTPAGPAAAQTNGDATSPAGTGQANDLGAPDATMATAIEPGDTTPDLKDFIPPGQNPGAAEVIARLRAAGINTGIAAFNPPGTSPPLIGIAVPEDFPLPEGFVRHGQATDDGQRIEPILMFSPDYDFYDAKGNPIPVPENRVVPPEYAPPGLKIRMIRIPPPAG